MLPLCYSLSHHNQNKNRKEFSAMATITQGMRYRLLLISIGIRFIFYSCCCGWCGLPLHHQMARQQKTSVTSLWT